MSNIAHSQIGDALFARNLHSHHFSKKKGALLVLDGYSFRIGPRGTFSP
jgi:hypothetical protein